MAQTRGTLRQATVRLMVVSAVVPFRDGPGAAVPVYLTGFQHKDWQWHRGSKDQLLSL
jgi:hypothetical protein